MRDPAADSAATLREGGAHPVLARLLAARGVAQCTELTPDLTRMLAPDGLLGIGHAAGLLSGAIDAGERICIVADYDCDGATACAVAMLGLRGFGARVDYLVPNRFVHGYGLGPDVVELVCAHPRLGRPDWIVTVDNGIASVDGVDAARHAGIRTIVTDHHLPGAVLPRADAIVNPNQPGCGFASRHLAGVGVMFYLLIALRTHRRRTGAGRDEPRLADLLDLVAVGTVADLVMLDANNRLLVGAGLRRIRAGRARPGLRALMELAGVREDRASTRDIGFAIAPRINAAGRLSDITTGIECLLDDSAASARQRAAELDAINRERRIIERAMRAQADAALPDLRHAPRSGIVISHPDWHEGVIGLLAGRLKERHYRPVIALAPAVGAPGFLRGSGRSIPGLHLRDVLETVANRHPELIARYGGHAMAAGLTLAADSLTAFEQAFVEAVDMLAEPGAFDEILFHDGPLSALEIDLRLQHEIDACVWGQGFSPPQFCNRFKVLRQRAVGDGHLKLTLALGPRHFEAIAFGRSEPLGTSAELVYRVERNDWQGRASLQLVIEQVLARDTAE